MLAWPVVRNRAGRELRDENGTSLVETAVAISIVLLLMLGVFDFALGFYSYHYVSDAAREATRWAMVRGSKSCTNTPNLTDCGATSDEIQSYVRGLGYPGIYPGNLNVTTTWLCSGTYSGTTGQSWTTCGSGATQNAPGNQVQVTVVYTFPFNIPFWNLTALWLQSTSSMVIAQ
jgi:Flp pilus assembly protein TadG